MDKKEVRHLALDKRNAMTEEGRKLKSARIAKQLESQKVFQDARSVLFYYSVQSEVSTLDLLGRFVQTKSLFLPRLITSNTFHPLPFTSIKDLEANSYGIPEPKIPAEAKAKPKLDLIIVPGVAFNRQGNRIGMGKGYYDRFLENYENVPKIALAYSEQVLESVPKEPYDIGIDFIATENEFIRCSF